MFLPKEITPSKASYKGHCISLSRLINLSLLLPDGVSFGQLQFIKA